MCSPLLLHVLCACNTTRPFGYATLQGHLLEQGLHVTVQGPFNLPSLSLLYLFFFIPKENMFLTTLKFAKFSDFKHNNIRPTVRMGTPLSGLPSYYPPPKSSQPMQRKCPSLFLPTEKTKAWAEYLAQSQ